MTIGHSLHEDENGFSFVVVLVVVLVLLVVAGVVWLFVLGRAPRATQEKVVEPVSESTSQPVATEVVQTSDFQNKVESGEYASIRVIGDSITAGFGTDGYVDPNITGEGRIIYDNGAGETWRETPASVQCWANAFRSWANEHGISNYVNAGISGWFMKDLATNPDAWIMEGADVMVVALGTNDAGYYGPSEYESYARTGLSAVAAKCKLLVVIAPPADLRNASMLVEPAAVLGDVLSRICAEQGYVFVDPRAAVTPSMFCSDGLHPNTEGSMAIWGCLRTTLGI